MPRFTFVCEDMPSMLGTYTGKKITKEFGSTSLEDILQEFETFLLGAGYAFNGHVDIVNGAPTGYDRGPTEATLSDDFEQCMSDEPITISIPDPMAGYRYGRNT